MPRSARAIAVVLALALGACGTVPVLTDDPRAQIFVDGRYMGRGEARVRRNGPPHTARILVKAEDGRRATATMKREMSIATALLGLATYGICLAVCWEYPGMLYVRLPAPAAQGGWDSADSPWLRPPAGWEEPGPPPGAAAPNGAAPPYSTPPQPAAPAPGDSRSPEPERR